MIDSSHTGTAVCCVLERLSSEPMRVAESQGSSKRSQDMSHTRKAYQEDGRMLLKLASTYNLLDFFEIYNVPMVTLAISSLVE